jgi:hypothetical protein
VPLKALKEVSMPQVAAPVVLSDYAYLTNHSNHSDLLLSMGSILQPSIFPDGYTIMKGEIGQLPGHFSNRTELIWSIGKEWVGTPYQWGGRSRFGVDCSGFIQVLMARIGIPIPRDSKDQLAKAPNRIRITEQEAITEGQLAFFGPEPNRIDHVGVVIPGGRILHSSGEVRIDTLTAHGIPKAAPNQDHNLPPHTHTLQAIASYI